VTDIVEHAVERASHLMSIEAIKTTAAQIKKRMKDGEFRKYFRSKKEFLKLFEPLKKRYQQLLRKI
jgi:radical SAM superfamily enzyme